MPVPAEYQLAAAIIIIYLLDCLALLCSNEGVVEHGRDGWRISWGSSQAWIAGRRIVLLNPFTPHVPAWRAAWHIRQNLDGEDVTQGIADRLHRQAQALRGLHGGTWAVWTLVLVALPLALCLRNTLGFVMVAMLAWSAVWALVIRLWWLRRGLGLSIGAFALVAFECVVCPPNAANLVRKLSMCFALDTDLVAISGLLPAEKRRDVVEHIDKSVAERQKLLDPETPEYACCEHYRRALATFSPASEHRQETTT